MKPDPYRIPQRKLSGLGKAGTLANNEDRVSKEFETADPASARRIDRPQSLVAIGLGPLLLRIHSARWFARRRAKTPLGPP
jgi:hypothetical protein